MFSARASITEELADIEAAGLTKRERPLDSPQSATVVAGGAEVLNFCANNYLGLADHPHIVEAAKAALDEWGFGMASVRFSELICGVPSLIVNISYREIITDRSAGANHGEGLTGKETERTPE